MSDRIIKITNELNGKDLRIDVYQITKDWHDYYLGFCILVNNKSKTKNILKRIF
jgi:hypothetical protein